MPHATLIDVFGPFRHDQALAAFGASDDRGVRGAKVHVHGPSRFCLVYVSSKKLFMFAVKQKSVEADAMASVADNNRNIFNLRLGALKCTYLDQSNFLKLDG